MGLVYYSIIVTCAKAAAKSSLFVGRWSLVVVRRSLVVGRWSLVVRSLVVGRWSLVVGRWSLVVGSCRRLPLLLAVVARHNAPQRRHVRMTNSRRLEQPHSQNPWALHKLCADVFSFFVNKVTSISNTSPSSSQVAFHTDVGSRRPSSIISDCCCAV